MAGAQKAASVVQGGGGGPSVVKEIVYGIGLGILAGLLWKKHHWNNQRRTREFYDMLEKGQISVVVDDADQL